MLTVSFFPLQLRTQHFERQDVEWPVCKQKQPHCSWALFSSPELWTLSTLPSWTRLCLSAGLLCPHVPYFPVTLLHTESAISLPSLVRNSLLLAGEADLPRFSTLSVDSSQLPALALCVLCLHICVCPRECAYTCVCSNVSEKKRESDLPRVHELQHPHPFKILRTRHRRVLYSRCELIGSSSPGQWRGED